MEKHSVKGLLDLIEIWCLLSREKLVPEAKREIKEYLARLITFKQEERERKIVKILESNIDRLNPKIAIKIVKQLMEGR